jgi:cell division protease FtsH
MKNTTRHLLILFVVFFVIAGLFSIYTSTPEEHDIIPIGTLVQRINAGEVSEIVVVDDRLTVSFQDGGMAEAIKEPDESLSAVLSNYNVDSEQLQSVDVRVERDNSLSYWLVALLPFLFPFLLIAAFIFFMLRQVQGANSRAMTFGQSKAREVVPQDARTKVTFKDVAGAKEAKQELEEIVEFLKSPQKFLSMGARIPKGVLLIGPPGTGKTLLARAVAGEAGVPFFSISGSEFVEMFVGVGASRVRDLFNRAKRRSPCIVFMDELDAVGRQRGAGLGGSNDEREQTLNQILVEMDGFDVSMNVIVMAATNRPDVLDRALLRPGRFDRQVVLDAPDLQDRISILQVHAHKKPLAGDINFQRIAARTPGFTGADLNNLLNEAAILAARRAKKKIEMAEILESIEKVMLGPERRSHMMNEEEKKVTAYHEAGHALVAHILPKADPVQKVTIVSRGRAAGYTLKLPDRDKHMETKGDFEADLAVLLAGFTVEKEIFKDVSTGASNDLKKATQLAKRIVTEYGMSNKLGPRTFGEREEMIFLGREIHEQRDYSEKTAERIDEEVSALIDEAMKTALATITTHRVQLEEIAKQLLERETLEREQFEAIFAPAAQAPASA